MLYLIHIQLRAAAHRLWLVGVEVLLDRRNPYPACVHYPDAMARLRHHTESSPFQIQICWKYTSCRTNSSQVALAGLYHFKHCSLEVSANVSKLGLT